VSSDSPEPPFDELLEQLKSEIPEPLFAAVTSKLNSYQHRLEYAELKIQVLEERLRLKRIQMYAPGSEKLTNEQLELLELEPGVSTAEVQAESAREPLSARAAEKRVRNHPGRQTLPAELPRVERVIGCTAEQCVCGGCGRETTVIGYEESEQLDVEPGEILRGRDQAREARLQELRGAWRAGGAAAAAYNRKEFGKRSHGGRYRGQQICGYCPLYRQSTMLERDSGVELSRQALDGWVMRVGELLAPLAEALRQELLRGSYLQADETPVAVQMHDGNGSNHLAYLWQYGQPYGAVVFDFRMGRGREGPKHFLGNFDGPLQSDGYAVLRFRGRTEDGAHMLLVARETKIRGSGEVASSRCRGGAHRQTHR
jgi:transposase